MGSGHPVPRFLSIKSNDVHMRKGPGTEYPITWKYIKKGYPLKVVAEFHNWRKVIDYDNETQSLICELMDDFIDTILENRSFQLKPQDNDKSTYLPRLYSEINGAIDFSWDDINIEKFIRAFGPMYPGAFTFLNDRKIHVRKFHLEKSKTRYHPFLAGKVLTVFKDGAIRVALQDNNLIIEEILLDGKIIKPSLCCKIMDTFMAS